MVELIIKEALSEMVFRPCGALFFSLEMMSQNVSNVLKLNTAISRSVHYLSRPITTDWSANRGVAISGESPKRSVNQSMRP